MKTSTFRAGRISGWGRALWVAALGGAFVASATAQYAALPNQVLPVVQRSLLVGHADPNQVIHLGISLNVPNRGSFNAFVNSVSDPKDPSYGKFLTPAKIGQQFGQSNARVQAVANYLQQNGFRVKLIDADHLHILADGTVAGAERAFHTTINDYHTFSGKEPGNNDYFAYASRLTVPRTISTAIQNVSGLESYAKAHHFILDPTQTRNIYAVAPIYNAGIYGAGRTVGISNWVGFRTSNVPLFYTQYGLPTPPGGLGSNIVVEPIDGGSGSGPENGEGDLDMQMPLMSAPFAKVIIYDGGNLVDVLTAEQSDNLVDDVSESYGWVLDNGTADACHVLHQEMSAQGITYMNATGDSGTTVDPYNYPDIESESLGVGGTVAKPDGNGNRASEVAWDGGGGGWSSSTSDLNVRSPWQTGNGVPTNENFRLQPDVSLNAAGGNGAGDDGAFYFFDGGQATTADGTSFASPAMAGCLLAAEAKLVTLGWNGAGNNGVLRFGRIANLFYSQNGRADAWFDVTQGSNGTLPDGSASNAGAGWDFCTGWGTINVDGFVKTLNIKPPISIAPTTVNIFNSQGANLQGSPSNLGSVDGLGCSEDSVSNALGQVAAMQLVYTVPNPNQVRTMAIATSGLTTIRGVSTFIYAYNFDTKRYDLLKTTPMSPVSGLVSVQLDDFTPYLSGGQVILVLRGIYPARLGSVPYTITLDQAVLGISE